MTLPLHGSFVDPGYIAVDNAGAVEVSIEGTGELLEALQAADLAVLGIPVGTAVPEAALFGPWLLRYTATDSAGNAAEPGVRRVFIDAACPGMETRCPVTAACSQQGICVPLLSGSTQTGQDTFVPVVDTEAPALMPVLTATSVVVVSAGAGIAALVDTTVIAGTQYSDAGASAQDAVDGNLTAAVSSYGLKAVSTAWPTAQGKPHVVAYRVADAAGNTARAYRRVRVVCAPSERICAGIGGAAQACSVGGICSVALQADRARDSTALPALRLRAPSTVFVEAGSVYAKCPEPRPLALICDQVLPCCLTAVSRSSLCLPRRSCQWLRRCS